MQKCAARDRRNLARDRALALPWAAMRTYLSAAAVTLLAACGAIPSSGAKLQEASQELNVNARFGRMEMAVQYVSAKEREEWARHHKWWGGKIRIADSEMAGTRIITDGEADVSVKVAWYRPDEQELHVSVIKQKWKDVNGEWKLVAEALLEGDPGLLGDAPPVAPAAAAGSAPQAPGAAPTAAPPKRKSFPTIRIGASGHDEGDD